MKCILFLDTMAPVMSICIAILSIYLTPTWADMPEENTNFAFDLYKSLMKKSDGNIFLSPISISMAMAMIAEGTGGNTKSQIDEIFGFENLNTKEDVRNLLSLFNAEGNNYTLSM